MIPFTPVLFIALPCAIHAPAYAVILISQSNIIYAKNCDPYPKGSVSYACNLASHAIYLMHYLIYIMSIIHLSHVHTCY
jgi:hypothetical protein